MTGFSGVDFAGRPEAGEAVVVFGGPVDTAIDLASPLGAAGFVIGGAVKENRAGSWVAGLGDVNGDGRGDFAVAAMDSTSYDAYVVYGPPPPAG